MFLQKVQMANSKESFFEMIDGLIRSDGFAFICIGQDTDAPPFAYTVGLTETYGSPELLIFGVGQQIANVVFHGVVDKIKAGARFSDGDVLVEVLNLPCSIRAVRSEAAFPFAMNVAARYEFTDRAPSFQQIVYPDRDGKFPWEPGYDEGMRRIQTELWSEAIH